MSPWVRRPAVAGRFYPADPVGLAAMVDGFLVPAVPGEVPPKALIVPHAGYEYSGPVAGRGYARVIPGHAVVHRVVLLGPAHRVPVAGLAASSAAAFGTPLGPVPLDRAAAARVLALPGVAEDDDAHEDEHCLEVQLPFLQRVLAAFTIVPLLVGEAGPERVAGVLDALWGGPETLVVVSSDLSHYLDHAAATARDHRTAAAITAGLADRIDDRDACGAHPIRGLLVAAVRRGLSVRLLDLRNSGDTAGPRDRVVGYGAFAVG